MLGASLLSVGLLALGASTTPPLAPDAGSEPSTVSVAIPDGGQVTPSTRDAATTAADIRAAAKAECQAVEPHVCHERALELLAGDAGAPEIARAQALMAEACERGFSRAASHA